MKLAIMNLHLANRDRQKVVRVALHDPVEQSIAFTLSDFPLLLHLSRRLSSVLGIPEGRVDVRPIPAGHWACFED
ncbi:hypothetical protein WJ28_16305 [Burkholderia thailandensis]|nr:hypothetical protein WJ27_00080 [Burkholderia thailandensis]KVG14548.1 hypothetical protein WJ28_16305 [Burkholderia thailandensis]